MSGGVRPAGATPANEVTRAARRLRSLEARTTDARAALDAAILAGSESGLAWTTLQELANVAPMTVRAAMKRARAARDAGE